MNNHTIDTATARLLAEAGEIRSTSIVGQPGGWSVVFKLDKMQKPLGAPRADRPRLWNSLDRCIEFLKAELSIVRFDMLDASNYSPAQPEAPAYDAWFDAQVEQAVREADDPATEWISHEDAKVSWADKRAKLLKLVDKG